MTTSTSLGDERGAQMSGASGKVGGKNVISLPNLLTYARIAAVPLVEIGRAHV